ncbi:hypothetical protein K469DRAFT_756763 [Zopfia rhizophila CBS 207.26]|uniref:Uncharacterized protein n=1 Tax=Zopfia rhizophila CBS 207.26 TaxID=1314779 RepID=A0A6A6D4G5_9PEZI|nr:hypothetical protein K469DRAFT_756763 [Zopfia rhizophila CBS 207.26]
MTGIRKDENLRWPRGFLHIARCQVAACQPTDPLQHFHTNNLASVMAWSDGAWQAEHAQMPNISRSIRMIRMDEAEYPVDGQARDRSVSRKALQNRQHHKVQSLECLPLTIYKARNSPKTQPAKSPNTLIEPSAPSTRASPAPLLPFVLSTVINIDDTDNGFGSRLRDDEGLAITGERPRLTVEIDLSQLQRPAPQPVISAPDFDTNESDAGAVMKRQ